MIFHIIGIKETKNKKYNMDILIYWESIGFVKTFLQEYNIIILNISEYKKGVEDFGKLKMKVKYKWLQVDVISYLTDIQAALFSFSMMWFDISYVNFTNNKKIGDLEVKTLLLENKKEVDELKQEVNQAATHKKETERKIYKDDKLEKTQKIAQQTFGQIDSLLQKVWGNTSKDKIRDIKIMKDELTKLKMWRNDDKMSELLEKIYDKSDEINKEYLSYMQKNTTYPIPNSVVSNIDIISEYQKLKKAKKIKEIWAKRDNEDNYYLSFESTWLYIKFLFIDIKNKIKSFSKFIYNLFWYLELATLFIIISTSLILWAKKVSYMPDENLYNYVFLIQTAVFWLTIFYIQKFKKQKLYTNILLIIISIVIAIVLFWLLKTNFSF